MYEIYYVKIHRSYGDKLEEFLALDFDLTKDMIKRQVNNFLQKDHWSLGDLTVKTKKCKLWNPDKPLGETASVIFLEKWKVSGTCYIYVIRDLAEAKEVIKEVFKDNDKFDSAKFYIRENLPIIATNPSKRKV